MGSVCLLALARIMFHRLYYIEHLDLEEMPSRSSRLWWKIIPGVGLWWYRRKFARTIRCRLASHIIAVSESVKNQLVTQCRCPPSKISVVRNGVNSDAFTRDERQGQSFRRRFNVPDDGFVFGMMARLCAVKGIDIAISAFEHLLRRQPNRSLYLVIAGDGPDLHALRQLAREFGVDHRVCFTGFVDNVADALAAYDVILFSSRREGLPLGLLEGMAAGCIPIVTRVSGMPEVVEDAAAGWVVSPENPEELCDAMEAAVSLDGPVLAKLRANAQRRVKERFDIVRAYDEIMTLCTRG